MKWNFLKRDRDLLDIFHILITLGIAVGGFFINQQQAELKQKLDRETATQTFTDKVFKHLGNLNLSPSEKEAMVIDLLDIITESNISKTGELTDVERRQLMPLRIALFTDNDEILTHIGADSAKRKLWVDFAERSGNVKVKKTAIRALENLGRYGAGDKEMFFSLRKIFNLGQEMKDLENKRLVLQSLSNLANNLELESARTYLQDTPADSLEIMHVYTFLFEEHATLKTAVSTGIIGENELAGLSIAAVDDAIGQLGELLGIASQAESDTESPQVEGMITSNIEKLTTEDSNERKSARVALARLGSNSIDALMQKLLVENPAYRIRLGVARAFNLMQQPVVIDNPEYVRLIVNLMGDWKAEIRKNATEFLAKLTDQSTVLLVYEELKQVMRTKENGNAVYNALAVFEAWSQRTSMARPSQEEMLQFLAEEREKLVEIKPTWRKTIQRVDQVLEMSKK